MIIKSNSYSLNCKCCHELLSTIVVSAARTDPAVIQYIQRGMEAANEKAISRAARVQVMTYTFL